MRSISRGMMSLRRRMLGILVAGLATLWLSGCTSESGNKIAVQTVGTGSPQQEWGTEYPIDARGYVNGVFTPPTKPAYHGPYPITYLGSWTIQITGTRGQPLYAALAEKPGDRVDIVGSFTRVIFEFHDPLMYANPGTVTFYKDNSSLGSFVLKSQDSRGDRIQHYQITNLEGKLATYSMVLNTGNVVLTGYALSHLYVIDDY